MQKRPDISLLKNTYLETYHSIERCLIQHNFSLLLSKKVENRVFDIILTAQNQKVPTKKLECNKDLNKFCANLIYEYNKSISVMQQILEGIFIYSLIISLFSLLDVFVEKGVLVNTLIASTLIFLGYILSSYILRRKKNYNPKLRSSLVFGFILLPFVILSFIKSNFTLLTMTLSFTPSLVLAVLACMTAILTYVILTKKYDLFIFVAVKK